MPKFGVENKQEGYRNRPRVSICVIKQFGQGWGRSRPVNIFLSFFASSEWVSE